MEVKDEVTMKKSDLYISVDIETNGPIIGQNAMLSFGCAALRGDEIVSTFTRNLIIPEGTTTDADTMEFWAQYPDAYKATQVNQDAPEDAFKALCSWVFDLKLEDEIPVFMATPIGMDFSWMFYYGMNVAPVQWWKTFNFQGLDIQSYAVAAFNKPYIHSAKKYWPKKCRKPETWEGFTHTHVALDDAIEQALQFVEIRKYVNGLHDNADAFVLLHNVSVQ